MDEKVIDLRTPDEVTRRVRVIQANLQEGVDELVDSMVARGADRDFISDRVKTFSRALFGWMEEQGIPAEFGTAVVLYAGIGGLELLQDGTREKGDGVWDASLENLRDREEQEVWSSSGTDARPGVWASSEDEEVDHDHLCDHCEDKISCGDCTGAFICADCGDEAVICECEAHEDEVGDEGDEDE